MVVKMDTGVISQASRLQSFVTLSTTEAEYIAAVSAGQEILWLRNLFTEFGYKFDAPSTLYMDNQSTLSVAKNLEHHGCMKHFDLRFYQLRDVVANGQIAVHYMPTDAMPADVMTKALSRVKDAWIEVGRSVRLGGSVENIILTLYGLFYIHGHFLLFS